MAQNGDSNGADGRADFAKAWKELQEGEQHASAVEKNLTALEKKIEDLLASAEAQEQDIIAAKAKPADAAATALGDDKAEKKEA